MVHMAKEMERQGLTHPPDDRWRHHESKAAHRRQDRAVLLAGDRPRPRRLALGQRRLQPPRRGAAGRARRREPQRARGPARAARGQARAAAAPADRGARQRTGDRLGRRGAARARVHGPAGDRGRRGHRPRAVHRLDVLLRGLGDARARYPEDSRSPRSGAPAARKLFDNARRRCSTGSSSEVAARHPRGVYGVLASDTAIGEDIVLWTA